MPRPISGEYCTLEDELGSKLNTPRSVASGDLAEARAAIEWRVTEAVVYTAARRSVTAARTEVLMIPRVEKLAAKL